MVVEMRFRIIKARDVDNRRCDYAKDADLSTFPKELTKMINISFMAGRYRLTGRDPIGIHGRGTVSSFRHLIFLGLVQSLCKSLRSFGTL
jgi:hypothetical protein